MMIGQATAGEVGTVLLAMTAIFLLIERLDAWFARRKGDAQKRDVKIVGDFASAAEVERLEKDVRNLDGKLETKVEILRAEGEQRAVAIHNRINEVLKSTATTTEAVENLKEQARQSAAETNQLLRSLITRRHEDTKER